MFCRKGGGGGGGGGGGSGGATACGGMIEAGTSAVGADGVPGGDDGGVAGVAGAGVAGADVAGAGVEVAGGRPGAVPGGMVDGTGCVWANVAVILRVANASATLRLAKRLTNCRPQRRNRCLITSTSRIPRYSSGPLQPLRPLLPWHNNDCAGGRLGPIADVRISIRRGRTRRTLRINRFACYRSATATRALRVSSLKKPWNIPA